MSRKLLSLALVVCLAWPNEVPAPPIVTSKFLVSDSFDLTDDQRDVAQQVETRLREYGFSDELIAGALVNAYAESKFDASLIGSAGERGIFQLNPVGLGRSMKIEQMRDIDSSVDRIAWAIRRSKRIMKLEDEGASASEHVVAFCLDIERPSRKSFKARERLKLMEKMLID